MKQEKLENNLVIIDEIFENYINVLKDRKNLLNKAYLIKRIYALKNDVCEAYHVYHDPCDD